MRSVKGFGQVSVSTFVAELPELGTLNRGQAAKLVGLAPMNNDSGRSEGKRKTSGGRSSVRRVLYMAAMVATRHNLQIRAFYVHLLAEGKQKKLALVAAMRKLLTIVNALIKKDELWTEPNSSVQPKPSRLHQVQTAQQDESLAHPQPSYPSGSCVPTERPSLSPDAEILMLRAVTTEHTSYAKKNPERTAV